MERVKWFRLQEKKHQPSYLMLWIVFVFFCVPGSEALISLLIRRCCYLSLLLFLHFALLDASVLIFHLLFLISLHLLLLYSNACDGSSHRVPRVTCVCMCIFPISTPISTLKLILVMIVMYVGITITTYTWMKSGRRPTDTIPSHLRLWVHNRKLLSSSFSCEYKVRS